MTPTLIIIWLTELNVIGSKYIIAIMNSYANENNKAFTMYINIIALLNASYWDNLVERVGGSLQIVYGYSF